MHHATLAAGVEEKTFYPVDENGDDITATTGDWQELYLPSSIECKGVLIQVQGTISSYNPETECVGFLWSSQDDGPGFLFEPRGKGMCVAKDKGSSLGFLKAESGKTIVLNSVE